LSIINSQNDLLQDKETQSVENWLKEPEIHQKWIKSYRSGDRNTFLDNAFDYIVRVIGAPPNAMILDVGCGSCDNSIRLAKRGFLVKGIDLSESVLEIGEKNIDYNGLSSKITLQCENIRELSFENQHFDYVLCWGVLMHIPDLEKAISELSRVLRPGGFLIISENNSNAIEIPVVRIIQRLLKKPTISKVTPFGIENWTSGSDKTLFCRSTNISWLINRLKIENMFVVSHVAGEFTSSYGFTSSVLMKKIIHSFNNFWFKFVKLPQPAIGNIIIFKKEEI
jgi:2-polyprenyl-3-methyl-5-hydroxy-6-metoxy-1,4-benzoquinol methylase